MTPRRFWTYDYARACELAGDVVELGDVLGLRFRPDGTHELVELRAGDPAIVVELAYRALEATGLTGETELIRLPSALCLSLVAEGTDAAAGPAGPFAGVELDDAA